MKSEHVNNFFMLCCKPIQSGKLQMGNGFAVEPILSGVEQIESLIEISSARDLWRKKHIRRFVIPPLTLGLSAFFYLDQKLVGWCSWALLNLESEQRLFTRKWPFGFDDWNTGNNLWIIDLIAPYGGITQISRAIEKKFTAEGLYEAKWIRIDKFGKRRRFGGKKIVK